MWLGMQPFVDAIHTAGTAPAMGLAAGLAVGVSPGTSPVAAAIVANASGLAIAPFLRDAVATIMGPLDTLIRNVKSPNRNAYSAAALIAEIRSAAHPEAVTEYAGYTSGANDPQNAVFAIYNTLALANPSEVRTRRTGI